MAIRTITSVPSVTAQGWQEWLAAWDGYGAEADEYRELDRQRVPGVFGRMSGRGKTSGANVETEFANLFDLRDGKVTRLCVNTKRSKEVRCRTTD